MTEVLDTDRIERSIDIAAPVSRVWRALTDHTEFGAWFGVALDGPFVPGEKSTGHMTISGYEHIAWDAVVVAVEPERLFSFTWHPYAVDPEIDYSAEPSTLVEFHLEPADSGTRLLVRETGFDKIPKGRRLEALRMNGQGWTFQMKNIQEHVAGA
ncbi:SRPBCC family protein [Breoghania sp. L-A4]|uniref:SRPBCC family protein n=1 Tax=Breoghania sp. L-A4 TaxID=2304600 RepID=UPI000E35DF7E|nr:SRPBCC family protein [Breoghania sp. L-A4]AXS42501.1 vanillate O-demethylase oxidoreductase VanB [Breoghania sp. L-A4]